MHLKFRRPFFYCAMLLFIAIVSVGWAHPGHDDERRVSDRTPALPETISSPLPEELLTIILSHTDSRTLRNARLASKDFANAGVGLLRARIRSDKELDLLKVKLAEYKAQSSANAKAHLLVPPSHLKVSVDKVREVINVCTLYPTLIDTVSMIVTFDKAAKSCLDQRYEMLRGLSLDMGLKDQERFQIQVSTPPFSQADFMAKGATLLTLKGQELIDWTQEHASKLNVWVKKAGPSESQRYFVLRSGAVLEYYIAECSNLQELYFHSAIWGGFHCRCLAELFGLQKVSFDHVNSIDGLQALQGLTHLQQLSFGKPGGFCFPSVKMQENENMVLPSVTGVFLNGLPYVSEREWLRNKRAHMREDILETERWLKRVFPNARFSFGQGYPREPVGTLVRVNAPPLLQQYTVLWVLWQCLIDQALPLRQL